MAEQRERKPGTGVAFANKNKKEDWHADWNGEFKNLDGKTYYINITNKVSQHSNTPYISVSLGKEVVVKNASPEPKADFADMTDDIPF